MTSQDPLKARVIPPYIASQKERFRNSAGSKLEHKGEGGWNNEANLAADDKLKIHCHHGSDFFCGSFVSDKDAPCIWATGGLEGEEGEEGFSPLDGVWSFMSSVSFNF